jgi:hypothetical protein
MTTVSKASNDMRMLLPALVTLIPVNCTGMEYAFFGEKKLTLLSGRKISLYMVDSECQLLNTPFFSNVYRSFCKNISNACGHGWIASYGHARKIIANSPSM